MALAPTRAAIADTGPLVAALDRRERTHGWVTERLKELTPPLLVCEAVLAETAWLLRRTPGSADRLLGLVANGSLRLALDLAADVEGVRALLRKYADQHMSLADACVVRMAEMFRDHAVLTLDSDFTVYRLTNGQPLPVISP